MFSSKGGLKQIIKTFDHCEQFEYLFGEKPERFPSIILVFLFDKYLFPKIFMNEQCSFYYSFELNSTGRLRQIVDEFSIRWGISLK